MVYKNTYGSKIAGKKSYMQQPSLFLNKIKSVQGKNTNNNGIK
jgi:hypothetical protein